MPVSRLLMDRELSRALDGVPMTPNGAFDLTDIPATRAAFRAQAEPTAASEPDDPSVITQEYRVSRADGPDVPVRLLRPATVPGPRPVMLWFHGGGQVLGFAAQDDAWLKPLCSQLACAVAVVDYRLAPETPSPAPPKTASPPTSGSSAKHRTWAWTAPGSASRARAAAEESRRPPSCCFGTAAARHRCSSR